MLLPVGIALGSNLGDSSAELDSGIAFLRSLSAEGRLRESPRLVTEPVDCPPGSPAFLNSVAEIELDPERVSPRDLLGKLQAFELARGRAAVRGVNTPRPLDLDILYYGDFVVNEPDLVIPHPRAHVRRFVLEPLAHLRPGLILPGRGKTVRELWRKASALSREEA
jgi:2-amino-4-hydroxy-6-hydroxymethyldihydropteridine diphosphokinase